MMMLPEVLRGVFFDFRWDRERLWALPTPVTRLDTSMLWWHLDLPVWSTEPPRALFDLAPRAVLVDLSAYHT